MLLLDGLMRRSFNIDVPFRTLVLVEFNSVLIFIIVILLLAADFYYCKNIAGRRLVGLRWWNEANGESGESTWVFESADESRQINATDSRFFWLSLYSTPVLWILLAVVAIVKFEFIWLSLVVIAVILCVTNGVAFSRADKFGNASSFAGRALNSTGGGLARRLVGDMAGRMFFSGR
ncbi:Golgi apparatus membrane protein tvp23 [Rhizina undulata]